MDSGNEKQYFKENVMRTLFSFAILFLTAAPAFADTVPTDFLAVPEPSLLALVGIGAVAFLVSHRGKK